MFLWIVIILAVILTVALNIESTITVSGSPIHSPLEKRKYLLLIWFLPIFGTILAMWLINKDIKKRQHDFDDQLAPVLKSLGDNIKKMEAGLKKKKRNKHLH